ncbi:exported hypothetical protein [Xanthomonas citri pv. citri]|nr:exported hypothetical protein [Xanthomonas citri pv. citri]CEE74411.1 exported hypothetical protein [Xanthomonas citri pv. citri]CEH95616.1 exported hypothetical protein [Xanthomonas citri pv. citri]CEI05695.1 exported hypothetical protein [Xanthomonas citri pv. citri]
MGKAGLCRSCLLAIRRAVAHAIHPFSAPNRLALSAGTRSSAMSAAVQRVRVSGRGHLYPSENPSKTMIFSWHTVCSALFRNHGPHLKLTSR